jgi:hypothetical protein
MTQHACRFSLRLFFAAIVAATFLQGGFVQVRAQVTNSAPASTAPAAASSLTGVTGFVFLVQSMS